MPVPFLRLLLAVVLTAALARPALAQEPSPEEAALLLQTRPDLVEALRRQIGASGLTPEQIRDRLRAEGYPESLLDDYLASDSGVARDSAREEDVFAAVRALGIADSTEVDSLRRQALRSRLPDSLGADSGQLGAADSEAARRQAADRARALQPIATQPGPPDSGFVVFGLELFRRSTSQFDPNLSGPVDANYRLGPGDRLVLILTGDVQFARTLEVTREGFIVIPQVGQLPVANLTLAQLEDMLYARLGQVYSGVRRGPNARTRFSISVARLRTNQVFVVGDVARPGSYRISSAGTALTALYAAGGPTLNGSVRRIVVRRGGAAADTLDLHDYLLRGDASDDVRLGSGDVVFVPVHGPRVRVVGEVIRPATYELTADETLASVLEAAGGFRPTASRRRVQIERILPPTQRDGSGQDRVVLDIASDQLASGYGPGLPLQAGDVVRVFPVAERVRNRITVLGNVWSPGPQGFTPGMRLSDALKQAGGVKPDVYLGRLLVTRLQPDSTRVQLRSAFRDSTGAVLSDFRLQQDDEIRVFSVGEFRPERYVAISGAVRQSGRFPYRQGMTVRDLILLAGGLAEGAYVGAAEVARLPEDRRNGVTAVTIRLPLDSSYVLESGPGGRYRDPPGFPGAATSAPEFVLQPHDNVLILQEPNWELQRTVVIRGEVRFPGRYSLTRKNERLSDLIKRAGGLTPTAYAAGLVFVRTQNGLGRIGLDLPRVLRDPNYRDNQILQDGDSIFLPQYHGVVNVKGAVNSPVAVAYVPGENLDYYIRAAGGPTVKADAKRAYVTQPNGQVESVKRRRILPDAIPKPRPGSTVVVPERDPSRQGPGFIATAGAVAQLLTPVVAIVAILVR